MNNNNNNNNMNNKLWANEIGQNEAMPGQN